MYGQYPSDVTDGQWQVLRKLVPQPARIVRPPMDSQHRFVCQSDWLPVASLAPRLSELEDGLHDLSSLADRRSLATNHDALVKLIRKSANKKPTPTAAIVDSQSIRTAEGGKERGYDAGKKITGRKRHLAVDTLGEHETSWHFEFR